MVGRGARTAATSTWCSPGAARRPRPRRRRRWPAAAGARAVPRLPGAGRRRAAGDDRGQQGSDDASSCTRRSPGARRSSAIAPGRAGRGRRRHRCPRTQAGELVLLVAVWVDPAATTRQRCELANREAMRARDRRRARPPGCRGGAATLVDAARGGGATPSTAASDGADRVGRGPRATRCPLDPPFRAAWDPVPRTRSEATLVDRARRRRRAPATRAAATGCPTRRCSSGCCVGVDPRGRRGRARASARRSTSTAGGRGRPRSRSGISSGARWASRCGGCSAAARSGSLAYASSGELRRAGRARAARGGAARRAACGRSSCASTTTTGATTWRRSSSRCATRSARTSS